MSRVYGATVVEELLDASPAAIVAVIFDGDRTNAAHAALVEKARAAGVTVREEGSDALKRRSGGRGGASIAAEIRPAPTIELDAIVPDRASQPLVIALDRVTDPHNLGAILRSAAAFGVTAIVAPKDATAPLNDAAVRASAGAVAHVPLLRVTNLARALRQLGDQGLWTMATVPDAAQTIWSADLTLPLVGVFGAEGPGLRHGVRKACELEVALPLTGVVRSLNVSVAAALMLGEAARQRAVARG